MIILHPKEVAAKLRKSLPWVYAHAVELGAVKIGGSWIFTEEGVEDAIQRKGDRKVASGCDSPREPIYRQIPNKTRSGRLGSHKTSRDRGVQEAAQRHGLVDIMH
jgi:hypothetical protein